MRVDLFDFELPEELIALRPARPRDRARLLHVCAEGGFEDRVVRDAPSLFRRGDLLVFNDTRVIRKGRLCVSRSTSLSAWVLLTFGARWRNLGSG
jgi:S-adenosylmethionine:tRNA-ribosyltransferase-isomerase (queuine synthetase)